MARASKTGVQGLYRDTDGRYRIDLRWNDAKTGKLLRHKERLPPGCTLAAAKVRAKAILSGALEGTFVTRTQRTDPSVLGATFDAYVDAMRVDGVQTGARVGHGKVLREVLGEARELATLVPMDLERVKRHLRGTDPKKPDHTPATINRHLTTAKHFLRWAAKAGHVPRAVATSIREDVRPLKEPPGRVRYVRADEAALFAGLTGWIAPIVNAARLTGCRLGELTSLRWRNVDLGAGTITLTKTKTNRTRGLPIEPELRAILDKIGRGPSDAYVFVVPRRESQRPTKRTEDQRRRDVASLTFARWATSVGLADFHFHDTRHDHATQLRRSGAGLDVIAAQLGHTTLQMSARYAHLADEQRRAAVAKVTIVAPDRDEHAAEQRAAVGADVAPSLPPEGPPLPIRLALVPTDQAANEGDSERCRSDSNRCVMVLQTIA